MRGQQAIDGDFAGFVSARTAELHRTAYLLTADQERAERLVRLAVDQLRRDSTPLSQAGAAARQHMARLAAAATEPSTSTDPVPTPEPPHHDAIAHMSPRQRAVLVLRTLDRFDVRSTARALGISTNAVSAAESAAGRALEVSTGDDQCRTALVDFAERATWPNPARTLSPVPRATRPTRPWWTYVAALVVIALTITTVVVTQRWHKDWLRTPDGLNDAHGTHFPTYTRGYRLVDVRDMTPGIAQNVTAGAAGAVALPCGIVEATVRLSVQSDASDHTEGDLCPASASGPRLTPVKGRASAMVLDGKRDTYPIGVYRKVPISEYPVATSNFDVQHDLSLNDVRRELTEHGKQPTAKANGPVLTLHGTAGHPNGTFKGSLTMPSASLDDELDAVGLLSPTTTGRFRVRIDGASPITSCSAEFPADHDAPDYLAECSLVDRQVPQVKFRQTPVPADGGESVPVEITVKDATGPWTLQVEADSYAVGTGLTY